MNRFPARKEKWSIARLINRVADYTEILACFALVLVIALQFIDLFMDFGTKTVVSSEKLFEFDYYLSRILNLIIGIEFTRMLCRHTPDTIIDVLMFATARQMIIGHEEALGALLSVLAIAILFAVRRYLIPPVSPSQEDRFTIHNLMCRRWTRPDSPAKSPQEPSAPGIAPAAESDCAFPSGAPD